VTSSQFGAPRGARGWVAAQVVSRLTRDANRWMVEGLEIGSRDRVLAVGCGPGHGVAFAAGAAPEGFVAGVDASATMVRQARRRNRSAISQGRVEIVEADAARLPFPDGHFGKAWSLDSLQFWPSPQAGLQELRRVVRPGGRVVVGLMARSDDPPGLPGWLAEVAELMGDSGLGDVAFGTQTFGGVVHWALLGCSTGSVPLR
jgi:ubiquinone/menaquinone biosynthesis C-methylase UbiE